MASSNTVSREEYELVLSIVQKMQEQIDHMQEQQDLQREQTLEVQREQTQLMKQLVESVNRMQMQNDTLYRKAVTDTLTRLPNREALEDYIYTEAKDKTEKGEEMSVAIFDIDKFKNFNDVYGHSVGDDCLKQVANTLRDGAEKDGKGKVFRWGGEEFVVVFTAPADKAAEIAEHMRKSVEDKPLKLEDGKSVDVTVSGGIANFSHRKGEEIYNDFSNALNEADEMLYSAKNNGRNRILAADENSLLTVNALDTIKELELSEQFSISPKGMNGVTMRFCKDSEFDGIVTIDFMYKGKNIASTYDINTDDLRTAAQGIRNGDTSYLIDESTPVLELAKRVDKELEAKENKADKNKPVKE